MSAPRVGPGRSTEQASPGRRRSYPFPSYPNSWYALAWSHEVGRGAAKSVYFFGRELVLFRGHDGRMNVVDAICPHLGAHLGGGKVVGRTIQCPFHGWRFDGRGTCTSIPYVERIPSIARVRGWDVREENGQVLVWFHAEGAEPTFEVPHLDGYRDAGWTRPRFHTITIRTHVQEMNENLFDFAHFVTVHHFQDVPAAEIELDGPHARVSLDGVAALPGRPLAPTRTTNLVHGAGVTAVRVQSHVRVGPLRLPLEFMVVIGKTPIDDEQVEHRSAIVFRRTRGLLDPVVHHMVWRQVIADIEQDARIWEGKHYLARPVLVKREASIDQFRKWHGQFYSTPAPTEVT